MNGCCIRGVLSLVPGEVRTRGELAKLLGVEAAKKVINLTGIEEVRLLPAGQTCADLAEESARRLLAKLELSSDEIDGLIFVTQTPDFVAPSTACRLQDRLGLRKNCLAFDVNLGCSGFPYALGIARGLIAAGLAGRVLLLVGDALSHRIHPEDTKNLPLFGDGVAAALVEAAAAEEEDWLGSDFGTDGSGCESLVVAAGQARYPTADAFNRSHDARLNHVPFPNRLAMDGNAVFAFTLREVPGIVERTLHSAAMQREDVDAYLFHQANRFIIEHLVKKIGLPLEKCPLSLDRYGNTSGASPAITACHALAEENRQRPLRVMFIGYGIGFSWGAAIVRITASTLFPVEELA